MRDLRRATIWLGLIGSVSLLSLAARAEDGVQAVAPDPLRPALVDAVEPSFHDVAMDRTQAENAAPVPDIALPEPAPVTITAADLTPADGLGIPLPDAAPVATLTQSDWIRIAVEKRLADDAAMRELRLDKRDR